MTDLVHGIYPNWKQARYVDKKPNVALIRAVCAVVPKGDSIVDLGAGCGWCVKRLESEGYEIDGVDGTSGVFDLSEGSVMELDLITMTGPDGKLYKRWDWALFSDVGEHVPREHEEQLIDNICEIPRKGFIVSWGYPHERGWNHVNLRTQVYIACEFARRGFWPDDELTQVARDASKFPRHHIRLFVARRKDNLVGMTEDELEEERG